MSTTGHENEAINVQGLKASLQKFKTDHVDGKAAKATTLQGYGITDAYTKNETYTKTEVNGLVSTPHQEYVTVPTYASLPASGSADTIYRVSSYDGANSQVDDTVYSEYAWDGTQYVFLCVKSQIDEVFDITVYNSNTKYANLSAALGVDGANIPQSLRRGGMSIKYVQSSDNKYVQYRLMTDEWSITPSDWQGVDDEPTAGSDNLAKSGWVYDNEVRINGGEIIVTPKTNIVNVDATAEVGVSTAYATRKSVNIPANTNFCIRFSCNINNLPGVTIYATINGSDQVIEATESTAQHTLPINTDGHFGNLGTITSIWVYLVPTQDMASDNMNYNFNVFYPAVTEHVNGLKNDVGNLSQLETESKTSLVSSINEVHGQTENIETKIEGETEIITPDVVYVDKIATASTTGSSTLGTKTEVNIPANTEFCVLLDTRSIPNWGSTAIFGTIGGSDVELKALNRTSTISPTNIELCFSGLGAITSIWAYSVFSSSMATDDMTYEFKVYKKGTKVSSSGIDKKVEDFDIFKNSIKTDVDNTSILYKALLPSYYKELDWENATSYNVDSYIEGKVASIPKGKQILFITDTHWGWNAKQSTNMMLFVRHKIGVNKVVFGGDFITDRFDGVNGKYQALAFAKMYMNEMTSAFGKDYLLVEGNHDLNSANNGANIIPYQEIVPVTLNHITDAVFDNEDEALETLTSGNDLAELKAYWKMHYWVDDHISKIRYIIFQTGNGYNGVVDQYFGTNVSKNDINEWILQTKWMGKALYTAPEGYDIVVSGHWMGAENSYRGGASGEQLMALLSARKARMDYEIIPFSGTIANYAPSIWDKPYIFKFSECSEARVITLSGHIHKDGAFVSYINPSNGSLASVPYSDNAMLTKGAVLNIVTSTDAITEDNPYVDTHVQGTIYEQCFDNVTITEDNKVICTRFGAGYDREFKI